MISTVIMIDRVIFWHDNCIARTMPPLYQVYPIAQILYMLPLYQVYQCTSRSMYQVSNVPLYIQCTNIVHATLVHATLVSIGTVIAKQESCQPGPGALIQGQLDTWIPVTIVT